MKKILEHVRAERAAAFAPAEAIIVAAEVEDRALTPEEIEQVRAIALEVAPLDERIAELADLEARNVAAVTPAPSTGTGQVHVRREPLTYERHNRQSSYFRDLGMAMVGGDAEARERLVRHKVEMDVEMPAREARQTAQFERALDTLSEGERRAIVEKRDITRTDGAGGEFVPPLWLLDLYAELPRAGRPFANRCRQIPLPGGTDSISIPRITTGTQVAAQTADNAAVNEQDLVTNSVTGPVRTIAGQQDIALQLLEQSPLMFDELVWADLAADYAAKLDVQCLNGTGLNGQHTGAMQVSSINSVTYTDASPTVPELYPSLPQALSKIASNRLLPPDFWTMHPRRWYWLLAALDSSNRPLVVPVAQGAYMALGAATAVEAEGVVGSLVGLPVLVDANIPATLTNGAGTGGTEDAIVAARMQDIILFEGAMRTRALPEVLSGTLTVRLQAYAYSAFIAGRQPKAIAAVTGTGLAAPSGF